MRNAHARNTVRYYLLIIIALSFLFFSNDFGLLDVQKTAIIMAAGIDKEGEDFIVTSQVAIPQDSKQGKSTESVQIVSRGKTVADAFEEINAKTGWYPKLVFCRLLLLGEHAAQENVFDALDYFLRDEYFSDNCYVATCDGYAKDLLNQAALVDSTSSVAIEKVLSDHAARVGTVLPTTLREFSIGYFGDSQSGFLPIVTTQPQQEKTLSPKEESKQSQGDSSKQGGGGENGGQSGQSDSGEQSGESGQNGGQNSAGGQSVGSGSNKALEKPVFSAKNTALFVRGKRVSTLTAEETFAFNAVKNKLRLAPYTLPDDTENCTLSIKQNSPKISLKVDENGVGALQIKLRLTAGALDYSKALSLEQISDVGDVPDGIFAAAEKKLAAEILSVFEKTRAAECDLFGVQDLLMKHKPRALHKYKKEILKNTHAQISVRFENVR
jgi:Ger(x)C family germination protein